MRVDVNTEVWSAAGRDSSDRSSRTADTTPHALRRGHPLTSEACQQVSNTTDRSRLHIACVPLRAKKSLILPLTPRLALLHVGECRHVPECRSGPLHARV